MKKVYTIIDFDIASNIFLRTYKFSMKLTNRQRDSLVNINSKKAVLTFIMKHKNKIDWDPMTTVNTRISDLSIANIYTISVAEITCTKNKRVTYATEFLY